MLVALVTGRVADVVAVGNLVAQEWGKWRLRSDRFTGA